MKRILFLIVLFLFIGMLIAAWLVFGSGTGFTEKERSLYIRSSAATKNAVMDSLRANKIVMSDKIFDLVATRMGYWNKIKPGKYDIKKGSSIVSILRKLRNGQQDPVDLVITKLRTKEDLAKLIDRKFEMDSADMIRFLNNPETLKNFNTDPEHAFVNILPDTYTYNWNASPENVYRKFYTASTIFWNEERKKKAAALGLKPFEVYTLASIVEEETNDNEEKDTIASVYLNRYRKNDFLGADPTVKYAVRDFTITWVHGDMLNSTSPYNTYKVKGLPPGPICTPSRKTIDAVLEAPQTDYYFFVANAAFNGTHSFSVTYDEHKKKAAAYQAEDRRRRELKEKNVK